ncbi:MAG: ParA family protein [Gemmataceae bacterium]
MTTPLLAITGHKGGTGRTMTTLALGTLYATSGWRVGLLDADPTRAMSLLVSQDQQNLCLTGPHFDPDDFDLVLMDCPPLHDPQALACLDRASGVVLTSTADLASLRTLGLASKLLTLALQRRRQLEFQGLLLTQYDETDPLQRLLCQELRRMDGELFLRVEIPEDPAFRLWPQHPNDPLPDGPARDAYTLVAEELAERLGRVALTNK